MSAVSFILDMAPNKRHNCWTKGLWRMFCLSYIYKLTKEMCFHKKSSDKISSMSDNISRCIGLGLTRLTVTLPMGRFWEFSGPWCWDVLWNDYLVKMNVNQLIEATVGWSSHGQNAWLFLLQNTFTIRCPEKHTVYERSHYTVFGYLMLLWQ